MVSACRKSVKFPYICTLSVVLTTKSLRPKSRDLACCALLLCAGAKEVQRTTFDALNGNSLVYDGRLVVDANFRTNDPCVYAGGPIVKLSRRYRSKVSMGLVSGRECGAKLAAALLTWLGLVDERARSRAVMDLCLRSFLHRATSTAHRTWAGFACSAVRGTGIGIDSRSPRPTEGHEIVGRQQDDRKPGSHCQQRRKTAPRGNLIRLHGCGGGRHIGFEGSDGALFVGRRHF